jgi:hypothetical protein
MKTIIQAYALVQGLWGFYIAIYLLIKTKQITRKTIFYTTIDCLWGLASLIVFFSLAYNTISAWMLVFWAITYWLMIPVPCYFRIFKATKHGKIVRNTFMFLFGVCLIYIALA